MVCSRPSLTWHGICAARHGDEHGGTVSEGSHSFNLALLAKFEWRILTRPASLLSRFLKATYFPTSSFEKDGVCSRPSLTWHGICAARQLLEKGC
ncbi:hypothetical protein Sango_0351000 [Sesamum angolense]|uniref:Uncharacterized protein n=1 Tax=Sesamum angolense TaxID=2727404 RepID=A0AAE1X9I1_9LAMI|nr:hypothetical protein Sango_0351000 [Sesamum angolense]